MFLNPCVVSAGFDAVGTSGTFGSGLRANQQPELLAQLPASIGGQPLVLALEAVAFLDDAPKSLLADLNLRLFNETSQRVGTMPKVGESLIFVAPR